MLMLHKRGTLTDQLNSVIQVIQLGKRTGLLRVEREEGTHLLAGEITFIYGHITQAWCEHLVGPEAVQLLTTWRKCRFLFLVGNMERTTSSQPQGMRRPTTQPLPEQLSPSLSPVPYDRGDAIPQRLNHPEVALHILEQAGLSRLHRHLFLLIDGHRTTTELARLIGRKQHETSMLLNDLQRIGIILYRNTD